MLQYAEALAHPRRLMPTGRAELQHALCIVGLALAACEKSVQIVYERGLRPPEKWHEPWLTRITGQLIAAFGALEAELAHRPLAAERGAISQPGISTAVAWQFTQQMLPELVPAGAYAKLAAFSAQAEALPEFIAAPHGEGTYRAEAG
jgi:hypothetical protein